MYILCIMNEHQLDESVVWKVAVAGWLTGCSNLVFVCKCIGISIEMYEKGERFPSARLRIEKWWKDNEETIRCSSWHI